MKAIEKARLNLLCNRFIRSLRFIIHLSINLFLISKEYFQQKFPSLTILVSIVSRVTKPKKERKYDELVEKKKKIKNGRGEVSPGFFTIYRVNRLPLRSKPPIRGEGKRESRKWPIYTTRRACHWQWKTFMETCFTFYEWSHRLLNPFGESTGGKNDGLWMA